MKWNEIHEECFASWGWMIKWWMGGIHQAINSFDHRDCAEWMNINTRNNVERFIEVCTNDDTIQIQNQRKNFSLSSFSVSKEINVDIFDFTCITSPFRFVSFFTLKIPPNSNQIHWSADGRENRRKSKNLQILIHEIKNHHFSSFPNSHQLFFSSNSTKSP